MGRPLINIFVYEYLTGGGIDPALAREGSLADLSALIGEGRLIRDALVASLCELQGVSVTFATSRFESPEPVGSSANAVSGAASGTRVAKGARPVDGEPILAFVSRMSRAHDYTWAIAPECDDLLLQLHDAVGDDRWLGCSREAIRIASSKRTTSRYLAEHGIATTPALEPIDIVTCAGSRWVVKPDDGAGSLDTFIFDSYAAACADYDTRIALGRHPVLQAWVDGEPLSLSIVCREDEVELLSINRQQIAMIERHAPGAHMDVVEFNGVLVDQIDLRSARGETLAALARRVASALPGLRGFVGIDLVWHPDRGPVVVEVNPRLTVAYASLAATAGRGQALTQTLLDAHGVRWASPSTHACGEEAAACGVAP